MNNPWRFKSSRPHFKNTKGLDLWYFLFRLKYLLFTACNSGYNHFTKVGGGGDGEYETVGLHRRANDLELYFRSMPVRKVFLIK